MGIVLKKNEFFSSMETLMENYRVFAPVVKEGAGRFTDVDCIMYDMVDDPAQIELGKKSDYSFKEFLTPLSETLFFFTENEVKEADICEKPVLVFLRSCDMHAVKRLDQIYMNNGERNDWFYMRKRDLIKFVLIRCSESFENCFCVDMASNRTKDGYVFSVDLLEDGFRVCVKDGDFEDFFEGDEDGKDVAYVTENKVHVKIPKTVPKEVINDSLWDEYTKRCINCGRCNFVCPTCTCYTMQDVFYTDNGKVGERRRVGASCMVNGYTDVAGGGQYRRTNGERMRFKVLHKISDFNKRFGYQMCVGCGRCDDVCPEYISYTNIINKVYLAAKEASDEE